MKNLKTLYLSILLLSVFSCSAQSNSSDFDKVCGYFQELAKLENVDTMTHLQRNDFIQQRISRNLSADSNARVAWKAIGSAVAEQRYELFQASAESVLNKKWQCAAMEKLAPITGEF